MRSIKAGLLASLVIFLYCCNSHNFVESPENGGDHHKLTFTAYVNEQSDTETRKSENNWESGDAIGVFAFKKGEIKGLTSVDEAILNRKFITSGNGSFSVESGSTEVPTPDKDNIKDFIAYYPYKESKLIEEQFTYQIDLSDQSNFDAIDLLYSDNLTNYDGSEFPILRFNHYLSRLTLKIEGVGEDLAGATVKILGIQAQGELNLISKALIVDTKKSTITPNYSISNGQIDLKLLVLPTGKTQSFQVEVTPKNGKSYKWRVKEDWKWLPGETYKYVIQLKGEGGIEPQPEIGYFETPLIDQNNLDKNCRYIVKLLSDDNPNVKGAKQRNFSYLYDINHKISYWVAYPMHKYYKENYKRKDNWIYDKDLPEAYQVNLKKINWSSDNFDRGHQIPSNDRTKNAEMNDMTFISPNATPQYNNLNQQTWRLLEEQVHQWSLELAKDTLYIVTGAGFYSDQKIERAKSKPGNPTASIPHFYYKVLAKKVDDIYYTIGFKLDQYTEKGDFMEYKTEVKKIEDLTGFTFFPGLPDAKAKEVIVDSKWTN